jgi:hypothetical protein
LPAQRLALACQHLQRGRRQCRQAEGLAVDQHRSKPAPVRRALRQHHTELRQMRAQGVDQARALAHQQVARPVDQQQRLLLLALDRHEPHRGACHSLTDRRGIRHVVLLPPHVRLDIGRRHEPDLMAQAGEQPRPMMRPGTRFHAHQARRRAREGFDHFRTAQPTPDHDPPGDIDAVQLKDILRQIQANCGNLHRGRLPQSAAPVPPVAP